MSKIKLPKGVKPIDKDERERLLRTINQTTGREKSTLASEIDTDKLIQIHKDCLETREYVLSNKSKFGENYKLALEWVDKLLRVIDLEVSQRKLKS